MIEAKNCIQNEKQYKFGRFFQVSYKITFNKYMFGFGQQNKRPCRNGLNCYYLRKGKCWFQHPDWHKDIALGNRHPVRTQYNLSSILRPQTSMETLLERMKREAQNKKKLMNLFSRNVQKQQQRTIIMNGKQIELIKLNSQLDAPKSWFFNNCHHYRYFPESQHKECSICINNFQPQEATSILFCKHAFHTQCIQKWLKTADKCPLCRKDFKDHQQFKSLKGYVAPRKNLLENIFLGNLQYQPSRFAHNLLFQNIELNVDYSAEEQFNDYHNHSEEISISNDQDEYQHDDDYGFDEDIGLDVDYDYQDDGF